jgi:hypothetical protein
VLGQAGGQIVCQTDIESTLEGQGFQNIDVAEFFHKDSARRNTSGYIIGIIAETRLRPLGFGAAAFAKRIVNPLLDYVFRGWLAET